MSKTALPDQPTKTIRERPEDRKAERSAAALRDNLKRRKAQQRARDEADCDEPADGRGKNSGAATEQAGREQAGRRKP
jgi:hypothetical protein